MDLKLTAKQYHVLQGYFKTAEKLNKNEKELFRLCEWIRDTYGMNRQVVFEIFKNHGCIVEIIPEKEDDFPKISREFWSYLEKGFERQREKLKEQGVIFKKENKPMRFFIYTGQDYKELFLALEDYTNANTQKYDAIFVEPPYQSEWEEMIYKYATWDSVMRPVVQYFNGILVTSTAKYKETFKNNYIKCTFLEALESSNNSKIICSKDKAGNFKIYQNISELIKKITLTIILNDEWYICQ